MEGEETRDSFRSGFFLLLFLYREDALLRIRFIRYIDRSQNVYLGPTNETDDIANVYALRQVTARVALIIGSSFSSTIL